MQIEFSHPAISPPRTGHRVLGLGMRPLTIGHLLLLLEVGSPYPDQAELADEGAMATAALICSQPHRSARKLIYSRFATIGTKLWGWLQRKCDLAREERVFLSYLVSQLARPESESISMGTKDDMRVPAGWRLLSMLMSDFRMSFDQALNTEVRFALTLWAVESDRRGIERIASERRLAFHKWVREQEAARKLQPKEPPITPEGDV